MKFSSKNKWTSSQFQNMFFQNVCGQLLLEVTDFFLLKNIFQNVTRGILQHFGSIKNYFRNIKKTCLLLALFLSESP